MDLHESLVAGVVEAAQRLQRTYERTAAVLDQLADAGGPAAERRRGAAERAREAARMQSRRIERFSVKQ